MTHQQLDILASKRHYAKYQNNTHGLDSSNLSLTMLKVVKIVKDTRSTNTF